MCHFTGNVKNVNGSKVALSACDGLAGFISVDTDRYFIEPLAEHVPNDEGQHLHVVYKKSTKHSDSPTCGTKNWEESWKQRFREKYAAEGFNQTKRGLKSEHRYLETAVVLDKKFIEHHKKIDYETYVMTLMNMVSDYYHDASSGNQMDVVIVRIIFLEKEEEEIDLIINPDADKTLRSFCNWQIKINPKDKENPNHHDIAVLITRYDICSDNMTNCGLMGLAYVAAACTGNDPCAICEEGGLVTSVVIAHEMGHVMGCSHDKEGESSCPAQDADESFFVMAPYVNLFTLKWSTCSKEFMTALFE
ncbi:unnamed protein product [Brassicogethes aeneus]|uniref:Peptidase M12B domain-containing protein n=1 Tax=Brassicogethes aeneus TaxID=1431903 RepID=A0A9P0FHK2_BRAAE|nr:unnamed protein product [Brassicogethes aeneus]